MKPEDAKALWPKCGDALWFERNRSIMLVFARACEQHGVERTVAALQATVADNYTDHLVRLTRESVAAELKKETE